ncbi:hypothetical protein V6259_13060 [Marinomonas sp. TI.3.20]|uniref:hypothetical protein n=1 Tax=Marinomonas sp. TI.3.20 TaxID=3121296 RepID=UPI00311D6F67
MHFTKTVMTVGLVSAICGFCSIEPAFGATQSIGKWFQESPKNIYFYVKIKRTRQNLRDFYAMQTNGDWKLDIQGLDSKVNAQNLLARLYRPAALGDAPRPFPSDKSWFNKVQAGQTLSFKIVDDMAERDNLIKKYIDQGYSLSFWGVHTDPFTWTVTLSK